ncbi:MAG: hypothetical protein K2H47_00275 [Muribaculaceae bacterium]|nr:hypothetical protein [Muribaculaceae bacterium]
MKLGAIITGDIVNSTKLTVDERELMLNTLQMIPEVLSPIQNVSIEIFRGDSFQLRIPNLGLALRCALAIRAWLRCHKIHKSKVLDARLAIGIGTLDYEADSLSTSDGEAYRLSGRLLDSMNKSRLEIITPWYEVNDELKLLTAFADDIVSSWSQNQSKVILLSLITLKNHVELSKELKISRQMVDKSLKSSKKELIEAYIKQYEKLINKHLYQV